MVGLRARNTDTTKPTSTQEDSVFSVKTGFTSSRKKPKDPESSTASGPTSNTGGLIRNIDFFVPFGFPGVECGTGGR